MISSKIADGVTKGGLVLPHGFQTVIDLGLVNIVPWHFVSDKEFDSCSASLSNNYPYRQVIPFARPDNDDVACFVLNDSEQQPGEIIVIHDFASPGWEVIARMKTFWDWFRYAIDEMISWHEAK